METARFETYYKDGIQVGYLTNQVNPGKQIQECEITWEDDFYQRVQVYAYTVPSLNTQYTFSQWERYISGSWTHFTYNPRIDDFHLFGYDYRAVYSAIAGPATCLVSFEAGLNGTLRVNGVPVSSKQYTTARDTVYLSDTISVVPDAGYVFSHWTANIGGSDLNTNLSSSISGLIGLKAYYDTVYTAHFVPATYTIKYSPDTYSQIIGEAVQIKSMGKYTSEVTAVIKTDHLKTKIFSQWSDGELNATRSDLVERDRTYHVWTTNRLYDCHFETDGLESNIGYIVIDGSGQQQSIDQSVAYNTSITATASLYSAYTASHKFLGWYKNDVLVTSNTILTLTITEEGTWQARFARKSYTVNFVPGTNGIITGSLVQTVSHGSNCTAVTAIPNENYTFKMWSTSATSNPYTYSNVTSNRTIYAYFEPIVSPPETYTVTYTVENAEGLAEACGNIYSSIGLSLSRSFTDIAEGSDIPEPIIAIPLTAYEFWKWADNDSTDPVRQDTNITADLEIVALFTKKRYTLTYSTSIGGSLQGVTSQIVMHGNNSTPVLAVPAVGYDFTRWLSDNVTSNPRQDLNVIADKTVTALFTVENYAVSFEVNDSDLGEISDDTIQYVDYNELCIGVTANVKESAVGYEFKYWAKRYNDGTEEQVTTLSTLPPTRITEAVTFIAYFGLIEHTLTYSTEAQGILLGATAQTVEHGGDGSTVTAVPMDHWHFVQWSDDNTDNPRTDENITQDISVTAEYAIDTFTLEYAAGANGSISGYTPQTVNYGASGTAILAVPDTGYHFVEWSDSNTSILRTDVFVTENISVTALFAINEYTIQYIVEGASAGHIEDELNLVQTVEHGSNAITMTAVLDLPTSHYFQGWYLNGSTFINNDLTHQLTSVTADTIITARFTINTYVITYLANNEAYGHITPDLTYATHGGVSNPVVAEAYTGYEFAQWSDGELATSRFETGVTENLEITAVFQIAEYSLDYTAGSNGSIVGDTSQTVQHGSDGTAVTAVADAHYEFWKWSDEVLDNPRADTEVTDDIAVTAIFRLERFTLTYTAGVNGSIGSGAIQEVEYGANAAPVYPVPAQNYSFSTWSDLSTDNPRIDTNVTGDITVEASFVYDPTLYTIEGETEVANTQIIAGLQGAQADVDGNFSLQAASGPNTIIAEINSHTFNPISHSVNVTENLRRWQHTFDGEVWCLQKLSDGSVVVGGAFTTINGISRKHLAHFTSEGDLLDDLDFDISIYSGGCYVACMYYDESNEMLYIGGRFGVPDIYLVMHNYIACVDLTYNYVDPTFTVASINGTVRSITQGHNGSATELVVGGWFTLPKLYLMAVDHTTGAVNATFQEVDAVVYIVKNNGTDLYVGGAFTTNNSNLAKQDLSTGTWTWYPINQGVTGTHTIRAITDIAGTVLNGTLIGGQFEEVNIGGTKYPRNNLALMDLSAGTLSTTTLNVTGTGAIVHCITDQYRLGGIFTSVNGETRNNAARINPNNDTPIHGQYLYAYNPDVTGTVYAIAEMVEGGSVPRDARVLVGGNFTEVGTYTRNNIAMTHTGNLVYNGLRFEPTINRYTIEYTNTDSHANFVGNTLQTVDHGEDGEVITATPDTGYQLSTWSDYEYVDPIETTRQDLNVTGDISVDLITMVRQIVLWYAPGLNASITGDKVQLVNYGGNGTAITVVPAPHCNFVRWSDSNTDNPRQDLAVTSNVLVSAVCELDTFTLTYAADANGEIDGNTPQIVSYGSDGTYVQAISISTLWVFDSWSDGNTDNPRIDVSVTDDITVTANFVAAKYAISGTVGVENVKIDLSDGQFTYSDSSGYFLFDAVEVGEITITPTKLGFNFTPTSKTINLVQDYTGFEFLTDTSVAKVLVRPINSKMLIGGDFTEVNGYPQSQLARFISTDLFEFSFSPILPSSCKDFLIQSDGKIMVLCEDSVLRLNTDGTADGTFTTATLNGLGECLGIQTDGKIIIGGAFTTVNGVTRNHVARLNTDGTLDIAFNPDINGDCYALVVRPNDRIIIGGAFTTVSGSIRNYIARLDSNGVLDGTFNQSLNGACRIITLQNTIDHANWMVIAGDFTEIAGEARQYVARLDADGELDASFAPVLDAPVLSICVKVDDTILIGGEFTTVDTELHGHIAQFLAVGTLDDSFVTYCNDNVTSIAVRESDDKIIICGDFDYVNSKSTNNNVRLNSDGTLDQGVYFEPEYITFTCTYTAEDGGMIVGVTPQTVEIYNDCSTVEALPYNNATFDGWSDGVLTAQRTDENITENITVTAQFTLYYTIQYATSIGGTIDGTTLQLIASGNSGTEVIALADPLYVFSHWSDGNTSITRTDGNVLADATYTANFVLLADQYTIQGNVEVTDASITVTGDDTLTSITDGNFQAAVSSGTKVFTPTHTQYDFTPVNASRNIQNSLYAWRHQFAGITNYYAIFAVGHIADVTVIGGNFRFVNGNLRTSLAFFDSTGMLLDIPLVLTYEDSPEKDVVITSLYYSPAINSLFIGGEFTHVQDGTAKYARRNLVQIDLDYKVTSFDAGITIVPRCIHESGLAVFPLGDLTDGLQYYNKITGALMGSVPACNGTVYTITRSTISGKHNLFFGGDFTVINGQTQNKICRAYLDNTTLTIATNFAPTAVDGTVRALCIDANGYLWVGRQTSNYLRVLNISTGGNAPYTLEQPTHAVFNLHLKDDTIFAGQTPYTLTGGIKDDPLSFSSAAIIYASDDPDITGLGYATDILGGKFTSTNGHTRYGVCRLGATYNTLYEGLKFLAAPKQFTLTYTVDANGTLDTGVLEVEQQVDYGSTGVAVTPTGNTGYSFACWSDNASVLGEVAILAAEGATTVEFTGSVESGLVRFGISEVIYLIVSADPISHTIELCQYYDREAGLVEEIAAGIEIHQVNSQNPRIDENVTDDLAVTAFFGLIEYIMKYTAGANGTLTCAGETGLTEVQQNVLHDSTADMVTAVPDFGYDFVGWDDGVFTNARTDLSANINVTAYFATGQWLVSYLASEGGTIEGDTSQIITHGSDGSKVTAVANTGWHFVNWSDASEVAERQEINVTESMAFTATFERDSYTLTYATDNYGTLIGETTQTVLYDDSGTAVTAVPIDHYTFLEWSDERTDNPRIDANVTEDVEVTARYTEAKYTITYRVSDSDAGLLYLYEDATWVAYPDGITLTDIEYGSSTEISKVKVEVLNPDYTFVQWDDGVLTSERYESDVDADKEIIAVLQYKICSISYLTDENCTVSVDQSTWLDSIQDTLNSGEDGPVIYVQAKPGLNFIGWSDGNANNPRQDLNIHLDLLVTALASESGYLKIRCVTNDDAANEQEVGVDVEPRKSGRWRIAGETSYWREYGIFYAVPIGEVTVECDNVNGFITPAIEHIDIVTTGTYQTCDIEYTRSVYTISGNIHDSEDIGQANVDILDADDILIASTDVNGDYTVSIDAGTTIILRPTYGGWSFHPETRRFDALAENMTGQDYICEESGVSITYTVSLQSGGGGSVVGAGTYAAGTEVVINALPDTGYDFVEWRYVSTGVQYGTDAENTFALNYNISLQAIFTTAVYTVTASAGSGGTLTCATSQDISYNTMCIVSCTSNTGYTFTGWYDENEVRKSLQTTYSFAVMQDVTLEARFVLTESIPPEDTHGDIVGLMTDEMGIDGLLTIGNNVDEPTGIALGIWRANDTDSYPLDEWYLAITDEHIATQRGLFNAPSDQTIHIAFGETTEIPTLQGTTLEYTSAEIGTLNAATLNANIAEVTNLTVSGIASFLHGSDMYTDSLFSTGYIHVGQDNTYDKRIGAIRYTGALQAEVIEVNGTSITFDQNFGNIIGAPLIYRGAATEFTIQSGSDDTFILNSAGQLGECIILIAGDWEGWNGTEWVSFTSSGGEDGSGLPPVSGDNKFLVSGNDDWTIKTLEDVQALIGEGLPIPEAAGNLLLSTEDAWDQVDAESILPDIMEDNSFMVSDTGSWAAKTISETRIILGITYTHTLITIADVQKIGNDLDFPLDGDYVLGGDITASETLTWNGGLGFDPIGDNATPFTGTFDGAGYTISGLFINRPLEDYVGLFGASSGRISNVNMSGAVITGRDHCGLLAGFNNGTIINCSVAGIMTATTNVGGLTGRNAVLGGIISDCYTNVLVTGDTRSGGLIGQNGGTVTKCHAIGKVIGSVSTAGGLIGLVTQGSITNCIAEGAVSCPDWAGGLIGRNHTGITENCYSIGLVTSVGIAGGLIGESTGITTSSYYNTETSGQIDNSGKGVPKTTAQMYKTATYIDWDFLTIWSITEGVSYPSLTPTNPIIYISSIEELQKIGTDPEYPLNSHYELLNDIDASATHEWVNNFTPIGYPENIFSGSLNGNGHVISNLKVGHMLSSYFGDYLIYYNTGTVKNLKLISTIGGLVNENHGLIQSCSIQCTFESSIPALGGLVRYNTGTIWNCCANIQVEMDLQDVDIGGLIGINYGSIVDSYAIGNIESNLPATSMGGLIGQNTGSIINCYSLVHVNNYGGLAEASGLVGVNQENGAITNCYAAGLVEGNFKYGITQGSGTVTDCFYDGDTTTCTDGDPQTTDEMYTEATFLNWDFADTWKILGGIGYPKLTWQDDDIELDLNGAVIFGDRDTDGSWCIKRDQGDLVFAKRIGGVWVVSETILAPGA